MTFRIAQKGEERSIFQEAWVSDFMAFISLLGEMCCYDMTGTLFNFEIILDLHKSIHKIAQRVFINYGLY